MASVIKGPVLSVTVALETRQFTRGIATLSSQMETMGRKIQKVGLYSTIAFGAIAATSASALARVEYSTTQIATLMDYVSKDIIPTMRDEIVNLSKTFGQSFDDMAKARYDIVSAGFRDMAQSATVLRAANELALAGAADVGTTSRVIVQALKAFSLGAEKATYISDLLFQTVKIGLTTVPELADALGSIFSTARAAGVPLEELTATVSVLTLITGDTNESVNALNRLLFAMSRPTDQAAEALREMGIEVLNDNGQVKSLIDVISQFRGMNLGMISELIGGRINAAKAMAILAQNTALYTEALDGMTNSAGSAAAAAALMMDTVVMKWRVMKQTFSAMRVEIGKATEDDMVDLMESLTGMMEATIKYTKENRTFVGSIFKVGMELGGLALAFALVLRGGGLLLRLLGKTAMGAIMIQLVTIMKARLIPALVGTQLSINAITFSIGALKVAITPLAWILAPLLVGLKAIDLAADKLERDIERSTKSAYPEHIAVIKKAAASMEDAKVVAKEFGDAIKKNDKDVIASYRAVTRDFLGNIGYQIAGFRKLARAIKDSGVASSTMVNRAKLEYEDLAATLAGMRAMINERADPSILFDYDLWAMRLGFRSFQQILDLEAQLKAALKEIEDAARKTLGAFEDFSQAEMDIATRAKTLFEGLNEANEEFKKMAENIKGVRTRQTIADLLGFGDYKQVTDYVDMLFDSMSELDKINLAFENSLKTYGHLRDVLLAITDPTKRNILAQSLGFDSSQAALDWVDKMERGIRKLADAFAKAAAVAEQNFLTEFRTISAELDRELSYKLPADIDHIGEIMLTWNRALQEGIRRGGKLRYEMPIVQDDLLNEINDQHYENIRRTSEITLSLGDALNILFNNEVKAIASTDDINEAITIATGAGASMFSELANIASRARQDVLSAVFDLFASILALVNMIKANASLSAAEAIPGIGAIIGAFAVLGSTLSGGRRRYQSGGVVQGHGTGHSSLVAVQDQEVILSKDMARAIRGDSRPSNININISPSITLPSGSRADVQRAAAIFSKESERELVRTIKNLQLRGVL